MATVAETNTGNNSRTEQYTVVSSGGSGSLPPMGWFDSAVKANTSAQKTRIDDMAARGFKRHISYWIYSDGVYSTDADIIAHLDYLQSKGMQAILNMGNAAWWNGTIATSVTTQKVNLVKGHPALAGYYVCDEPTGSTAANQVKAHAARIRDADSNTSNLIYGIHYLSQFEGGNAWSFYENSAIDVVGLDDYPVGEFDNDTDLRNYQGPRYNTWLSGVASRNKKAWFTAQANCVRCAYPALTSWYLYLWPTVDQMKWQRNFIISSAATRGVTLTDMYWYSYYDCARLKPEQIPLVQQAAFAAYP